MNNSLLQYICESDVPFEQDFIEDKIIVSMTSWTMRISNIKNVIQSILDNTVLPYKIIINLAIEEFPNKEKDLSIELVDFINNNQLIEINWVLHNTKIWKKSIPALLKYPNSWILCIDDDFLYPKDFIETFSNAHKNNPNIPLSGVNLRMHANHNQHCGCASLDSLKYLSPYLNNLNQAIFNAGDEDTFYTYCYYKNNIDMLYVGKMFHENMQSFNSVNSYSRQNNINTYITWQICQRYI